MTPEAKLRRQARRIATSTRKRQSILTLLRGLRRYLQSKR